MAQTVKNMPTNVGDPGLIPGLGRCPGEGSGNSLRYSFLENSMSRGAWQATVHTVAKSQTRLKQLSAHTDWKTLQLPSFKTKEPRDNSGLMDRGSYPKQGPEEIHLPWSTDSRQDVAAVFFFFFLLGMRGRLPALGGTDVRLTHWFSWKPAEEHATPSLFDALSMFRS